MSQIVAEVLMVLVVIIMSSIVYIWATSAFSQNLTNNNNQYAYLESFKTVQGSYIFSSNVGTEPTRAPPNGPWTPNQQCTVNSPTTLPHTGNILVPANAVCTGQVTVKVVNTGSIPITFRAIYLDNGPQAGISWTLGPGAPLQCGNTIQTTACTQIPVIIPVRQAAQINLVWNPPSSGLSMNGLGIQVRLVSSYNNFVDSTLYLT